MPNKGLKEAVVTDFIERMAPVSTPRNSDGLRLLKSEECEDALRKLELNDKEKAILHESTAKARRPPNRPKLRVGVEEEDLRPADSALQALNSPTASCKDGMRDYAWTQALSRAEAGTPADPSGFIYQHRVHLCDKRPLTPLQRSVANSPGSPAVHLISPIRAPGTPNSSVMTSPSQTGGSPRSPWMTTRSEKVNWNSSISSQHSSIKEMKDSILYPESSTPELPDFKHWGYGQYYQWRDAQMKQVDVNRIKIHMKQKVKARTEQMRANIPAELCVNPSAKGIKSFDLPPSPVVVRARASQYGTLQSETSRNFVTANAVGNAVW
eukprot:CAMPEP_0118938296 /NCGR_PEP_ID=MMETSP1169-20130426/25402_1 /TAXON_ID=36882 /ORGANISM="Pyramimonas obovata, Strain CCMP722" /LENGTH=323 /DNA_ID=CAMNT_0006882189 /DNA_START=235 /DNA_END=1203 /DNA_ORIENTATION=-